MEHQLVSLEEITITALQQSMEHKQISTEEVVRWYLNRIEQLDANGPRINSLIHIQEDALEIARKLDQERMKSGARSALHGIPVILKDNYNTFDLPTTAGSVLLKNAVPPQDAFLTKQLREAGAVILAKANMDELSFGISCKSSLGGQTLNPYHVSRHPGGSSGGTGAAIAANFGVIGMGTDTGISIRLPAAHNNLVGLRPTYGLTSRSGIVPISVTQDIGGPLARTVSDIAHVLDVIAGALDPHDPSTQSGAGKRPARYTDYLHAEGLRGKKLGLLNCLFGQHEEAQKTNMVIKQALKQMAEAGAEIIDVDIPQLFEIDAYVVIWEFETTFNDYLAKTYGNRAIPISSLEDVVNSGEHTDKLEPHLRNALSRSINDPHYKQALANRKKLREAITTAMDQHQLDAFVYPTVKSPAPPIGEERWEDGNGFLSAQTGLPAISVPAGFTTDGLPVGLEFLARKFEEAKLIELAYGFEQHTQHRRPPNLSTK